MGGGSLRATARVDHRDLPPEVRVTRIDAVEALSTMFDVRVELACLDANLDLDGMLWSTACAQITPEWEGSQPRSFHGVIEEARYLGSEDVWHRYSLRLHP